MKENLLIIFAFAVLSSISCRQSASQIPESGTTAVKADSVWDRNTIVHESGNLVIKRLSDHVYEHTSFLTTNDFGKVDCNGMIVVNGNEAVIFDTPSDDAGSMELIQYISDSLQCRIEAIVPTHFHEDCVGGMEVFYESNIPAYAFKATIDLLNAKGRNFSRPFEQFSDSLVLDIGGASVYAVYFGEGHTKDNIVGYFPADGAIFGGCLIKAEGVGKGNLEDANTADWSETVHKLRQKYPHARIVIPGHGKSGGIELLDYTIALFE